MKFLIWGGNGWIGSMLCEILQSQGHDCVVAKSRIQYLNNILSEIDNVNPDFVINCAGITGKPTVDYCEDHKEETYLINSIGPVNLAHACWIKNIHLTNYATGCIYRYTDDKKIFTEEDPPNFKGSTYSKSKILAEELLAPYNNVLTLRIRMPVSGDMHPKCIITKLSKYNKLINIPNSVTVLEELLPISIKLIFARKIGIYNLTNPGAISHNEIMSLYKKYLDPAFTWSNFTEDEQNNILRSQRSNCQLDTSKLESFHPVTDVHSALNKLLSKWSKDFN